jgi:hypothetical protein
MRGGDEELRDEVFVSRRHSGAAFAAAPLRAIRGKRHALDVTLVRDCYDAVFALNEVFILNLTFNVGNFRLSRRREFVFDRRKLVFDDLDDAST